MDRPNNLKVSSFLFQQEQYQITMIFSFWSGKIVVSVNDQEVASLKSFSENATLFFTIDEIPYSISLVTKSILKGPMICILRKQGEIIQQKQRSFNKTTGLIPLILFAAIATGFGRIGVLPLIQLTTLPIELIYLIQGTIIILIMAAMIFWKKSFLETEEQIHLD